MTTYDYVERAVELDNIVIELTEALVWIRKRRGVTVVDPELENRIARRLAIGCIKHVHWQMHTLSSGMQFDHRSIEECRQELIKRCEELRFLEVRELMHMARGTNAYVCTKHNQYFDLDW